MSIRSKLLTYQELHEQEDGRVPYTYKLKNDNASLFYFGSAHIFDPDNSRQMIKALKAFWQRFQTGVEGDKVVFIEGTSGNVVPDKQFASVKRAVRERGESGLVSYLAKKDGVAIECPEIAPDEYTQKLAQKFPKNQIIYYLIIRSLAYNSKRTDDGMFANDMEALLARLLDRWEAVTGWGELDFTREMIENTHEQNFNGSFEMKDTKFFDAIRRPGWQTTAVNRIAQENGRIRDERIVEEIDNKIDQGVNLFVVFGSSHARIQEPALRNILIS